MPKSYDGINIQSPISQDIVSGKKTIETRTYPLPEKYLNKEIALIETPGPQGDFRARIIAIIKFTDCFKYKNKTQFYNDSELHLVTENSPWAWKDKPKFGWQVEIVKKLSQPVIVNKRKGIVFTRDVLTN